MNTKRMIIALILGALAGLFCVYGTKMAGERGNFTFPITTGLLVSTFYSRVLIGFVIGLVGDVKIKAVTRGALMGIIVGLAMALFPFFDMETGGTKGALIILVFSAIYGIIIDVVATKFSKSE